MRNFFVLFGVTIALGVGLQLRPPLYLLGVTDLVERLEAPLGFNSPQLDPAEMELIRRGPNIVPALFGHVSNPRPSSWQTVGYRVEGIIHDILEPEVHVDRNMNLFDKITSYSKIYIFRDVGVLVYCDWMQGRTNAQHELAYLRWYVRKIEVRYRDKARGADHLAPFKERIRQLEQAGVDTTSPAPKLDQAASKPLGSLRTEN